MIQANELRIKNLVYDKDNNVREICGIQYPYTHLTSLRSPVLAQSVQFNEIEPIKLTEEILLKCGFIFDKSTSDIKLFLPVLNLSLEIHATFYHGQFVIELINHLVPIVTELESIHQLQNLYFSLTGKELEVNL